MPALPLSRKPQARDTARRLPQYRSRTTPAGHDGSLPGAPALDSSPGITWSRYVSPVLQLGFEPIHPDHADELFAELSDPNIYRFTKAKPPASREWLRHDYMELASGPPAGHGEIWLNWVIRDPLTRALVGALQATRYHDSTLWIGYTLVRRVWGQGYATAAARWLVERLTREFGPVPIYAAVDARNGASIRVLEKAGFRFLRADSVGLHGEPTTDQIFRYPPERIGATPVA